VTERYDVFVIGGGGTGSEIAFRLGERGDLRVAIAERDTLGGECNHYGCVPTKVMLRSARIAASARDARRFGVRIPAVEVDLATIQQRARDIVASNAGEEAVPFERIGVAVYLQEARLLGPHDVELADGTRIHADKVVLATGTDASAPPIEGLADGPYWTNREAIWEPTEPPGSLAVLGSGAIGIEFAQIYARLGSHVIVLEALPRIIPAEDEASSSALSGALSAEGIDIRPDTKVIKAVHAAGRWKLTTEDGGDMSVERLLVATGRTPVFDGHDLDAAGIELDEKARPILSATLRTTGDKVWAAGDATGDLLFTHVGTYEARLVVDDILGQPRPADYRVVPRVTYCDPEVASVGLTEDQAREAGHDIRTAELSLADNERSDIDGRTAGMVKLVADADTGELLGGHIVGEDAGAMIHEVVVAMAGRVPASVVGGAIHAYPTLSESVKGTFERLAEALDGEGA
jgi:pyruvate/2-oxoglutarate dehydrogenase complex dihydrolipoamide dehydrogenase (E3) component